MDKGKGLKPLVLGFAKSELCITLDAPDLLGCSINLVDKPAQVADVLNKILQDPDYFQEVGRNGEERMGQAGASARIAKYVAEKI